MPEEITIFNFTFKTRWLWLVGAVLVLLLIVVPVVLTVFGPLMGRASYALEPGFYGGDSAGYYYGDYDDAVAEEALFLEAESAADAAGGAAFDQVAVSTPAGNNAAAVPPQDRLIIREGSISMTVDDTQAARAEIEALVADLASQGAFVVSANESESPYESPYINMTIRVPSGEFFSMMDSLAGMAVEVIDRNENAQDVTEEYVDLASRVESLEAARDRLLELMENAETTEALLLAEQQLTQRESQIESLKARLQFLSQSAQLSRVYINLNPYIVSQPIDTSWRPMEAVRESFDDLIDMLQDFVEFLIRLVIVIIPGLMLMLLVLWLVWLALRFVWRRTFGRNRGKNKDAETASEDNS